MANLSRRGFLKKTVVTTVGVSAMLTGGASFAGYECQGRERS